MEELFRREWTDRTSKLRAQMQYLTDEVARRDAALEALDWGAVRSVQMVWRGDPGGTRHCVTLLASKDASEEWVARLVDAAKRENLMYCRPDVTTSARPLRELKRELVDTARREAGSFARARLALPPDEERALDDDETPPDEERALDDDETPLVRLEIDYDSMCDWMPGGIGCRWEVSAMERFLTYHGAN